MAKINLSKGQVINLTKEETDDVLEEINVGMGWKCVDRNAGPSKRTVEYTQPVKGFTNWLRGVFGKEKVMETVTKEIKIETSDYELDLDASCVLHGMPGANVCFYGHKDLPGVHSCGDNLTGSTGKNDDETIKINLKKIPLSTTKISVFMNIYQASARKQSFASLERAYVRIYNTKNNNELCRFDLTELDPNATALVLGDIFKTADGWQFKAIGKCCRADIPEQVVKYTKD